jgi:hypothetical protein
MGDRRFQNLAGAGPAGFYLGEMQGPMSRAILSGEMDASEVMLNTAPVGLYAPGYAPRRRAISPAYPPGAMSPVRSPALREGAIAQAARPFLLQRGVFSTLGPEGHVSPAP